MRGWSRTAIACFHWRSRFKETTVSIRCLSVLALAPIHLALPRRANFDWQPVTQAVDRQRTSAEKESWWEASPSLISRSTGMLYENEGFTINKKFLLNENILRI